jgi:MSHA biogenesis protein MshQ
MGVKVGPRIIQNGLILDVDAAVSRSYSGTGITANGLIGGIGGTLVNGVGFSSSNNGTFVFDGTNDYMDCGYNSNINNATQLTIECWYRSSNISKEGIIFGTNSYFPAYGYHMEIYQSKLLFQVFPSTSFVQSSITLSNNIWYHLVGTYNSGAINLYVNGITGGSGNYTYSASSENLILGRYYAGTHSLEGQLSNVKFYNRSLTAQEVLQNYNATKGRYR